MSKAKYYAFFLISFSICIQLRSVSASENGSPLPEIVLEMITTAANPDLPSVETALSRITEEKLGCRVSIREIKTSEHAATVKQISNNNRIDIIVSGFTVPLPELKALKIIRGISDLLDNQVPGLKEKCGRLLDACRIGGQIYCIPGNLYPAVSDHLFYRSDLDFESSPDIPEKTYGEIASFFRKIRDSGFAGFPTGGGDGFRLIFFPEELETFGDSLGFSYGVMKEGDPASRIYDFYSSEEFADYCMQMSKWYSEGLIEPDSLLTGATLAESSQKGRIGAFIRSCDLNTLLSLRTQGGYHFSSIPLDDLRISTDAVTSQGLAVTSVSRRPELCLKVIELLYTDPDAANLLNYGIEGLHYRKLSDRIIERIPGENGSYGYGNFAVFIGDAALTYRCTPADESFFDMLPAYSIENAKTSSAFGYIFDTQPVAAEVSRVNEIISLYRPGLICGCTSAEELLPRFISELKNAGIDTVIAENQRQFDEWTGTFFTNP